MSYDLLLDSDGQDMVLNKGKFYMTSSARELLRQRLYILFRAFVGEWFLNTEFGLYDKSIFLSKGVTQNQIDAYIVNKINQIPEVDTILSFESEYNNSNRVYSLTFVIKVGEDTGVYRINLTPPGVEISYPDPQGELEGFICDAPNLELTNAFYEMMNFGLPGDIAWL